MLTSARNPRAGPLATVPPILQFGTSRFLQAHVDLFVCEAARRHAGDALGKITVVQTTQSAASHARIAALQANPHYPVRIRGLADGQNIDTEIDCDSVADALHADADWPTLRARIRHDVQVIVSNTGDTGYALFEEDDVIGIGAIAGASATATTTVTAVPRGFVAKLVVLLHERYVAGADPITVMPCELVSRNGDVLRGAVVELARRWDGAAGFIDYLEHTCIWINALVDRIVSTAIDPIGAIAEPYALWAIERQAGMILPCVHPSMVLTDDLAPFERRKLFLLNLGHSVLAQCWLDAQQGTASLAGLHGGSGISDNNDGDGNIDSHSDSDSQSDSTTVLQAMQRSDWRATLESVWRDEVMPVFTALGEHDSALHYLSEVRDRFGNPFLAHRLADIAQHHAEKKQRRFKPVVTLASDLGLRIEQRYLRTALASE